MVEKPDSSCLDATEKELVTAVRDTLNSEGFLGKIKAEVRHEVLRLLGASELLNDSSKPPVPPQVHLINDLVLEYLHWIGYSFSAITLKTESQPRHAKRSLSRKEMEKELKLEILGEENRDLPLLCILINLLKDCDSRGSCYK